MDGRTEARPTLSMFDPASVRAGGAQDASGLERAVEKRFVGHGVPFKLGNARQNKRAVTAKAVAAARASVVARGGRAEVVDQPWRSRAFNAQARPSWGSFGGLSVGAAAGGGAGGGSGREPESAGRVDVRAGQDF